MIKAVLVLVACIGLIGAALFGFSVTRSIIGDASVPFQESAPPKLVAGSQWAKGTTDMRIAKVSDDVLTFDGGNGTMLGKSKCAIKLKQVDRLRAEVLGEQVCDVILADGAKAKLHIEHASATRNAGPFSHVNVTVSGYVTGPGKDDGGSHPMYELMMPSK